MEKDRVQPHTTSIMKLFEGVGDYATTHYCKWRQREKKVEKDRTNNKETVEEEKRLETMCKFARCLKI